MPGVLADSTILSNFALLQRLDLLQQAFPNLSITPAVLEEIRNGEETGRLPVLQKIEQKWTEYLRSLETRDVPG